MTDPHRMHYDIAGLCWWVRFGADEVARMARVDRGPEFRGDCVAKALDELAKKAHGRLREARQKRSQNMRRRWRHQQPRRILA